MSLDAPASMPEPAPAIGATEASPLASPRLRSPVLIALAALSAAVVAALLLGLALDPAHEPRRLLWAAIAGGFLLVASLAYPAGMGMGDVKLLAVMGLLLGAPVLVALIIAGMYFSSVSRTAIRASGARLSADVSPASMLAP